MLGTKFYKDSLNLADYSACAEWCNSHNAVITDKGDYYECVEKPAPNLDEAKRNKIEELKAVRNAKELEPIRYNGHLWDFDKDAIMRMELAERALRNGGSITWTDAENARVNGVDADDLTAILNAGTNRSNDLHIRYNELKAMVNNAKTVDDVDRIEWQVAQ